MKIQYELKLLQAGYCHYLFQNNTLKSSAAYFLGGGKKKKIKCTDDFSIGAIEKQLVA